MPSPSHHKKNLDVHFSSRSIEWSTPDDLFDELNDIFHFDLDACATKENARFDSGIDEDLFKHPGDQPKASSAIDLIDTNAYSGTD